MTSIWYCNGCDWFEDLRFGFLIVVRIGVVKLLQVLCEIVLHVSLIDAAWEFLRVFSSSFFCVCAGLFIVLDLNRISWLGEEDQQAFVADRRVIGFGLLLDIDETKMDTKTNNKTSTESLIKKEK